jgi:flavin-dependent dehydrogenase
VKIVIVGGGSSGWLVASGLVRYCPNYEISVIESPTIPTIGVGESTTAYVKHFVKDCLKIDENHFLKETSGIYKMSVKFKNFSKNNPNGYHYPFGIPYTNGLDNAFVVGWDIVKTFDKSVRPEDFVKFMYPAHALFSKNKIDENLTNEFDSFNFDSDLGYHFDANKVGKYLQNHYCAPKGVKHISDNVKDVSFLNDEIEYLVLESGQKVYADLFIDCTGFKSLLLGQRMKPKFIDVSNKLLNNRAWATPTQYTDVYSQMQPYTTATALGNGWAWYTPIASRVGNGYAYSENFIDPQDALDEFKGHLLNSASHSLTKDQINDLPFFEIKMKTGFYETAMVKNVVGIGMSSGFLEPLEGTGLHFIIESIYTLIKTIENGKPNQFLIDSFNLRIAELYRSWVESLSFFYLSSRRDDTEYWEHINKLSFISLDFNNKGHFHDLNDFASRLHYWTRHYHENDLFNNVVRGAGLINNFNQMDADMFSMSQRKHGTTAEDLYKKYYDTLKTNMKKWEDNSTKALHIYDFLKSKGAIG